MAPPESTLTASGDDYNNHGAVKRPNKDNVDVNNTNLDERAQLGAKKAPVTGIFGIRWAKVPGEIESLNNSVGKISQKFVDDNKKHGVPIPPEVEFVLQSGENVYKKRWTWFPVGTILAGGSWLIYSVVAVDAMAVLTTFIVSYIWYDLFSGILHVLLDNPLLMKIPVLNEPCLEFQWHHHLPHDLCSKSFLEVCGDLNMPITLIWCFLTLPYDTPWGVPLGLGYRNPLALNLIAWKFIMAYFGQLCHSMSHMPASRRPQWVNNLQNCGLMLPPKEHALHHKTYDDKFCIGTGLWNPFLTATLNLTDKFHCAMGGSKDTNAYSWVFVFGVAFLIDVPLFNAILTRVLP